MVNPTYGGNAAQQAEAPISFGEDGAWGLMGGTGGKALKWTQVDNNGLKSDVPVGTTYTGLLQRVPDSRQRTDIDTGKPLFWNDDPSKPKIDIILTLDTDYRDDNDPLDEGVRTLYINSGGLMTALQAEMRAKHLKKFGVGSRITVQLVGYKPAAQKGFNPARQYKFTIDPVEYVSAAETALVNQVMQTPNDGWAPAAPSPEPIATSATLAPPARVQDVVTPPASAVVAPPARPTQTWTEENLRAAAESVRLWLASNYTIEEAVPGIADHYYPGDNEFKAALVREVTVF